VRYVAQEAMMRRKTKWMIEKDIDHRGQVSWSIGRLQWIPEQRVIYWNWIKEGEWQSKALLEY